MSDEAPAYHPTLWRTCRALMNERRLRCLKAVFDSPFASVGEIASLARLPENQASMNLRSLQARGLITAVRQGRWTRYTPSHDPLVEHAQAVSAAIRFTLEGRPDNVQRAMKTLRAFTHARRLLILRFLKQKRPATTEQIIAATHISVPATWRHLATLRDSGLATFSDGLWSLAPNDAQQALDRVLLASL